MVLEHLWTCPLPSSLFSQATHPSEPLLTVGLANGHVQTFRLPNVSNERESKAAAKGWGVVDTVWKTQRHKGSCRVLAYSHDGSALYSGGSDLIVKHCNPEDGVVVSKIILPESEPTPGQNSPTVICPLTPKTLLLGTDSGSLYVFDIRENGSLNRRPAQKFDPHSDWVSSISPLPPSGSSTSGFPKQWVSTGETTVAYTDLRKGVLKRSEDQEDELLCGAVVPRGLGPKKMRDNPVLLVGCNSGMVTTWDHGSWDDQTDRINVKGKQKGRGGDDYESVECIATVPEALEWGPYAIAGLTDGGLYQINLKKRVVDSKMQHDIQEGVTALSFDVHHRLISGGGPIVKMWADIDDETMAEEQEEEEEEEEDDDDDDEDSDDEPATNSSKPQGTKRPTTADSDEDDGSDSDEDSKKSKKRKGRKGKAIKSAPLFPGID